MVSLGQIQGESRRRIQFVFPLIMVVNGCTFHAPYPTEWAELEHIPEDCPNIAGIYVDRGDLDPESAKATGVGWWHVSLSGYLGLGHDTRTTTHVEISQPNARIIEVTAWENDVLLSQKTYSRQHGAYECESGFVKIDTSESWFAGSEVMGYERGALLFRKSIDGALIMQSTSSGFGMVLLILPAVADQQLWYRFEPK